jgi:hypothetical protein
MDEYLTTDILHSLIGPRGRIGREVLSGDHIRKVIPVPIPNTEVKLSEPMIVPTSAKVGIAGF